MNRQLDSPCPAGPGVRFGSEENEMDAWGGDDSLDTLEYTTAITFPPEPRTTSLARAKPRRAPKTSSFAIREDTKSNITGNPASTTRQCGLKRKTQDGSSSILAQPAQRFQRPRISFADISNNNGLSSTRKIDSNGERDMKGHHHHQTEAKVRTSQKLVGNDALKKDVRRRTVYIPTEDTTVPTVFMGLFSPLKSMDNSIPPTDETVPILSLEARIAAKKNSRKSSVEKPRRAPLQQSRKVTQQSTIIRDVVGKNGGKENIPPGYVIEEKKRITEEKPPISLETEMTTKPLLEKVQNGSTNSNKLKQREKIASSSRSSSMITKADLKSVNASSTRKQAVKRSSVRPRSALHSQQLKETLPIENRQVVPSQPSFSTRNMNIDQQFPVFKHDISNPAMYEDDWLSHQEVVITQLVNGLLDSVEGKLDVQDPETLRHELLHIYQSDTFLLLYKRLQASILYGALAPPKDIIRRGNRLPDDLGMKRSFLNFWSDTYDLHALRGAAEIVIGREISMRPIRISDGSLESSVKQQKSLKRTIESFLDTFLIRNMDKEANGDTPSDITGVAFRRTLLRSILIIILLDKARLTLGNSLSKSLFISSSPYKSSSAVLQALANLLLPSMGDINRQLNHLDCHLSYKQHQLQDYDFRIHNLAVDLRDGVILTRLVEILFYPSTSLFNTRRASYDAMTLKAETSEEQAEWPLSQCLKFPCASKAAKVFNVQIALDALKKVTGIDAVVKELSAEHIVDGYREKTIALLWILVGKWGLAGMLDWIDTRNEIVRLQKKLVLCEKDQTTKVDRLCDLEAVSHEDLLIKWASTLAQLKGLQFVNLTTSFADGKIFESIIDEYESLLLDKQDGCKDLSIGPQSTKTGKRTLQTRLQALGCSSQFASLVAGLTSTSRIFNRDFVVGALTFLCSRLLSSSKRIRAAIIIQTAWRRMTTEEKLRRRVLAKSIAEQCAAVACARERILWSKAVIVKWWREQKAKKNKSGVTSKGRNPTRKVKPSSRLKRF